jgi:hypothetical protein
MSLPLNRLEPNEVEALDADQLVRLLHRLLLCEARHYHIKNPNILVPFQINVPDGGRDGKWHADIGMHEFIPRPLTYYQCKAEHITDADCEKEVAPDKKDKDGKTTRVVKERVREVLSQGGCYAFFSSKHEIKPNADTDLATIVRKRLQLAGFHPHPDARIEFFGSNRIADWANRFPSAVRFVREITKDLGGVHFYTVEQWQRQIERQGLFFPNDKLREKIAAIQSTLAEGRLRIIRLTGLSGLGKTRLVFEAVKPAPGAATLVAALAADSIYLSYADVPDDLVNFISHLASGDYAGTVIVDDCPEDIHDRLAAKVAPSSLSLVTIFHEPQAQRKDTQPLELEPEELSGVVEQILRQDEHLLAQGDEAVKTVAGFTEGFPQMAKLVTELHRAPSKQELSSRAGLFQKLLGAGRDPTPATLKTIQTLALFRVVGGSKRKLSADLQTIRTVFCPDVPESDFLQVIEDQKRRRIVQVTADTLTIAPRPLAVALAANFLPACPGDWKAHLETLGTAGLAVDLARRIEELEVSEKVEELGRLFLEEKIPFDHTEYLLSGTTASLIFRAFSVLNPSSAARILKRTLGPVPLERLTTAKDARRNLIRAIDVMVWESSGFFDSAPVLLRLAAAENEHWANNATGELGQLFRVFLSGTTVPANERLRVLRDALASSDAAIRRVAVGALGSALQAGHYSRMSDTTLGGKRNANRDWRPSTHEELQNYWKECYLLLQDLILSSSPEADLAKDTLAKRMDGILSCKLLLTLEPEFKKLAGFVNRVWPEMKNSIRRVLDFTKELTADHRAVLERWLSYVTPTGVAIEERLRDVVSQPGYHHRQEADGHYTDLSQVDAEQLARELSQTGTDLAPHLPLLLTGEQQQGVNFGVALARQHPAARDLLDAALAAWPGLKPEAKNDSLLRGLFFGVTDSAAKTTILDRIAGDAALIELLVPLTSVLGQVTELDFARIRRAIEEDRIPPERFRGLIQGLPLRNLPDEFIKQQFIEIARIKPATATTLFQVLSLYCHNNRGRFRILADAFRELLLTPNLPVLDAHFGWEWHEAAAKLIEDTADTAWLVQLAQYILNVLKTEATYIGSDYLRKVTIALFNKAIEATWPPFAAALLAKDEPSHYIIVEFLSSGGHGFEEEDADAPVLALQLTLFRSWLEAHRDQASVLLNRTPLYTVEKDAVDKLHYHWHAHALVLIELATDEDEATRKILGNLWSFGSVGSRVPYWERRKELVAELAGMPNPKFQRIARELDAEIVNVIEEEKRREINEHARYR